MQLLLCCSKHPASMILVQYAVTFLQGGKSKFCSAPAGAHKAHTGQACRGSSLPGHLL
jgi:hypothetical protein